MKKYRNKLILAVFAVQVLMLVSVITLVYAVSYNGRTVVLTMTGYDPYDVLRGRYLRLSNPDSNVILEPGSISRYEAMKEGDRYVYVIIETEPDSGISHFSYASLDRPDDNVPYIKCASGYPWKYDDESRVAIYPHTNQYYLNEKHADLLEHSVNWNDEILMSLKIWHGMYVIDGIEVDGQKY